MSTGARPHSASTLPSSFSKERPQATSPTTGQTRPHSAGSKGSNASVNQKTPAGGEMEEPSNDSSKTRPGSTVPPADLFPLSGFLRTLLSQEKSLWDKNDLLLKSMKGKSKEEGTALPEMEPAQNGSLVQSAFHPPAAMEELDKQQALQDNNEDSNKEGLYFIRYGMLTDEVHKYFRKLEKRHACLHLTARRSKHETLRHVERTEDEDHPYGLPANGRTTSSRRNQQNGVVILREDELLVYRCALMCSQFPMLSAPSPPDGQSPTPPPPPLPSSFHTTPLEHSLSIPNEAHHQQQQQHQVNGYGSSRTVPQSISASASARLLKQPSTTTTASASISSPSGSTDTRSLASVDGPHQSHDQSHDTEGGGGKGGATAAVVLKSSEPVPIKGAKTKVKTKSIRRHSGLYDSTDSSSLAKLPPGDSDEEAELVKLMPSTNSKSSQSSGIGDDDSSPPGREHPFTPMVNREMLYSMVRRAFRQTEEQQVNFETSLRQEYGRRSKGEILAKELAGQLQVLDNNGHPFYKPKLFVTRNGYDLWLQGEKDRVRKLIDKFWHRSLPRPQLWRSYNPTDYHKLYILLLRKIIDCESQTDRKEPVHSGKTPSAPLSPTAHRLLTEFGLRYGVGELYRRIVYLEYLAKHFDYEIWYIKHCTEELRSIRALLPRNRNRITAVRPEMEILRTTVHLLHGQADNSLTRIDRLFLDSDPRKGVASLIELLDEVLDAEQNLFGKKVRSVEDWLKRYLKSGFVLRYERRKEIASDETITHSQTVQPFVLTPTLVNSLLLDTRDEVYDFRDKFQSVFRKYFDIVPFSKVEFYRLLCSDACSLCARTIHAEVTQKSLSLEMLGLMYRLNERDIEWQGIIEPEHQLWRQQFQNLACTWMEVLGKQIHKWVVTAIEKDQWTLLMFDEASSSPSPPSSSASSVSGEPLAEVGWQQQQQQQQRRGTGAGKSTQILSSIRISPFPSPPVPEGPPRAVIGDRPGAFTPYKQALKRHFKTSPVSSESSGAVTDSVNASYPSPAMDTSSGASIAGEVPWAFRRENTKGGEAAGSIVTFGHQRAENKDTSANTESTLKPHQLEVSAAAYRGDSEGDNEEEEEEELVGSLPRNPDSSHSARDSGSLPPLSSSVRNGDLVRSKNEVLETSSTSTGTLVASSSLVAEQQPHTGHAQRHSGQEAATGMDDHSGSYKFHNLLDKCSAEDSSNTAPAKHKIVSPIAIKKPTPTPPPPPLEPTVIVLPTEIVASPASTTNSFTWPHGADGQFDDTVKHSNNPSPSPSLEASPSPVNVAAATASGPLQSYLFPVSNSPIDMVTMLSRLASFTGELLAVLTPKIRKSNFAHHDDKLLSHDEYAPEVTKARQQASERQQSAMTIKLDFLKRLNKIMVNSLKLYADNLLCMDLCGWTTTEVTDLLGGQKLHHLNRRKDSGDIWGCRHMVEARHGMHPNGIPCNKRSTEKFERITRDMCIRINNLHMLITIFHSLEEHLYSTIRMNTKRPITAFGYISSDPSEATPNMSLLRTNSKASTKPNPSRTRPQDTEKISFGTAEPKGGSTSWPSSISTGLGPMEPDHLHPPQLQRKSSSKRKKVTEDEDLPQQSLECLEYLRTIQQHQVKMMALRMNKFCKCALSELLGLRLVDCPIEKRLEPVTDYLERHRVALQKYVYPKCFTAIMKFMWDCLLQDLEEEAAKLRFSKRPVTDRAQMILQALAHLIQFMHNREHGLDIDILNSASDYLQGLLDIMTRSTDQLINIFNKLNTPLFNRNILDLGQAPIKVDSQVLHQLRSQLGSVKKCFTGKEFVDKVVEIGQDNAHVLSHTGQPIEYSEDYANSVAQFLLDSGILILVPRTPSVSDGSSSILLTPEQITDDEDANLNSRRDLSDSVRPLNSAISLGSGASEVTLTTDSPRQNQCGSTAGQQRRGRAGMGHYSSSQNEPYEELLNRPAFSATATIYYKFAGSEDDSTAFSQSQILKASSISAAVARPAPGGERASARGTAGHSVQDQDHNPDFVAARQGTLCLVYDLLTQRARKERVARQYLSSNRVQELKRGAGDAHCGLIFKM